MRVALVHNPHARGARAREIEHIDRTLRDRGIDVVHCGTLGSHVEGAGVLDGVSGELDVVLACGGDGTIHEALQALMRCANPPALGIVPRGSGNLLAKNLGIPRRVDRALATILAGRRVTFPVAVIETQGGKPCPRYWLGAAGVGADARVICGIDPRKKARWGIAAYYAEAARLLVMTSEMFTPFQVEWRDAAGESRSERVTQVILERIGYFGPAIEARERGELGAGELRAVLFKSDGARDYLSYGTLLIAHHLSGHRFRMRDVEVIRASELTCRTVAAGDVMAEVEGELLGALPVRAAMTGQTVDVILPEAR